MSFLLLLRLCGGAGILGGSDGTHLDSRVESVHCLGVGGVGSTPRTARSWGRINRRDASQPCRYSVQLDMPSHDTIIA